MPPVNARMSSIPAASTESGCTCPIWAKSCYAGISHRAPAESSLRPAGLEIMAAHAMIRPLRCPPLAAR